MRQSGGQYVENHYCGNCLKTVRHLSTGTLVPYENRKYLVMVCEVCTKKLWRLVEEDGRPILAEVSDG